MARGPGSKKLILEFFLNNIGKVLESRDIQEASGGAVEWARRVRELRNEDGYQILSHKDRSSLKPNQYLLETDKRIPAFTRNIRKKHVRGFLREMDTPARCAELQQVILTRLAVVGPSG